MYGIYLPTFSHKKSTISWIGKYTSAFVPWDPSWDWLWTRHINGASKSWMPSSNWPLIAAAPFGIHVWAIWTEETLCFSVSTFRKKNTWIEGDEGKYSYSIWYCMVLYMMHGWSRLTISNECIHAFVELPNWGGLGGARNKIHLGQLNVRAAWLQDFRRHIWVNGYLSINIYTSFCLCEKNYLNSGR